jgi:hypothetical protein
MQSKLMTQARNCARFSLGLTAILAVLSVMAMAQGKSAAAGNWSGHFSSHNFASFPVSFAITQDVQGNLHGKANMVHPCMKDGDLIVTIVGNNIVLGGSDADGDTVTFRGTLNPEGKVLDLSFVMNGSPSGRCETDQGSGSMVKQ